MVLSLAISCQGVLRFGITTEAVNERVYKVVRGYGAEVSAELNADGTIGKVSDYWLVH